MGRIKRISSAAAVAIMGAFIAVACNGSGSPAAPAALGGGSTEVKPGTGPMQLNLSHILCTADGVEFHFVLLFVPSGTTPGTLSFQVKIDGAPAVTLGPVSPSGPTGNVWHYNYVHPTGGNFEVVSAQVTVGGTTVNLHNPGDYTGDYNCGSGTGCPVTIPSGWTENTLICLASPIGSPNAECGLFGLAPSGKDDGLSGTSHTFTQGARLALVKDGVGDCAPGQNAYAFYENVTAGGVINPPLGGDISHVTYCDCPQ